MYFRFFCNTRGRIQSHVGKLAKNKSKHTDRHSDTQTHTQQQKHKSMVLFSLYVEENRNTSAV